MSQSSVIKSDRLNSVKNNPSKKKQKYLLISSMATLLAACGSEAQNVLKSIGDVTGSVTNAADQITLGAKGEAGTVDLGGGDDTVVGGAKVDFIRGGAGADNIKGGAGRDNLVMIGTTKNAGYQLSDLTNPNGTGIDLSALVSLDDLNNNAVSDASSGEVIDGGADGAVLFVYGEVDFTGITLINITIIDVHSEITVPATLLKSLIDGGVFQQIHGDGSTELIITHEGADLTLDLSAISMKDIAKVTVPKGVTLKLDQADLEGTKHIEGEGIIQAVSNLLDLDGLTVSGKITILDQNGNEVLPNFAGDKSVNIAENSVNVGTFAVTDESAVGEVTYKLSGADASLFNIDSKTGAVTFKTAPDFENAQDHGADNQYDIFVTATDARGKSVAENVEVNVTNVAEGQAAQALINVQERESFDIDPEKFVREDRSISAGNIKTTNLEEGGVVTWRVNDNSGKGTLKAKLVDKDGHFGSNEISLNTSTDVLVHDQDLVALENGSFVVIWHAYDDGNLANKHNIIGRIFDKNGTALTGEVVLNDENHLTHDDYNIGEFGLTALKGGGFAIDWMVRNEEDPDGDTINHYQSYMRFFDENGVPKTGDIAIGNNEDRGVTFVDLNGSANAIIRKSYEDPANQQIVVDFYDNEGVKNGDVLSSINRNVEMDSNLSNLGHVVLSNGGLVIAWRIRDDASGDYNIYARIFSNSGESQGSDILLKTSEQGYHPKLTALDNGGFKLFWEVGDKMEDDAFKRFSQTYDQNGVKIGESVMDFSEDFRASKNADRGIIETENGHLEIRLNDNKIVANNREEKSTLQKFDIADLSSNFSDDLNISVISINSDDQELVGNIRISDVPNEISFNNGVSQGNGTWLLQQADLKDLQIISNAGFTGHFELTVEATTQSSNTLEDNVVQITLPIAINHTVRIADKTHVTYPTLDLQEVLALPANTTQYDLGQTVGSDLATAHDITALDYQKTQDGDVGNPAHEPTITILAQGTVGEFDYYKFTITDDDTRMIFDIDYGRIAPTFNDVYLTLLNEDGDPFFQKDNGSPSWGGGGSTFSEDSYFEYVFSPGTYYLQVGREDGLKGVPFTNEATYELQVSKSVVDENLANDAVSEYITGTYHLESLTYAGNKLDYSFMKQDQYLKVTHTSGTEDLLLAVENLKFADVGNIGIDEVFNDIGFANSGFSDLREFEDWLVEANSYAGGSFVDIA